MKTAVVMVTIGPESQTRPYSIARAKTYAARHGYEFVQITEPTLPGSGRTPHWEKVLVPRALPGYDRYFVIDDDVLINTRTAPALPDLPPRTLGIVREPVPTRYAPPIRWLGNSGVLLFERSAADLMDAAYALGELTEIEPGYGDQPAVNQAAWTQGRVTRLGWRWNFLAMAHWLRTAHGQRHPWTKNLRLGQLAKLTFFACLGWASVRRRFGASGGGECRTLRRLRDCYTVHLTWFRMGAGLVDQYLG